jgi:hypothetical protein
MAHEPPQRIQKRPLSANQLRVMMEEIAVKCAAAMQDIYESDKVYDDLMAIRAIALDGMARG